MLRSPSAHASRPHTSSPMATGAARIACAFALSPHLHTTRIKHLLQLLFKFFLQRESTVDALKPAAENF